MNQVWMTGNVASNNGRNRVQIASGSVSDGARLMRQTLLAGYELDGNLVVPVGATLTVEPGVVVMAQNGAYLRILGRLQALGTVTQPITFTSATDTGNSQWAGLFFDGGTGDLRQVTLRYAGQSNGLVYSGLTARNVLTGEVRPESSRVISNGNSYGDYALYLLNSPDTISDTLFRENGTNASDYPLYVVGISTVLTLTGSTFTGNSQDRVLLANGAMLGANAALRAQPGLKGYELEGNFTIPAGITLNVEPGVRDVVTAQGHLVCPGFIDMHAHSDFNLLVQPAGRGKIYQGVTTEVCGNCGVSGAPLAGPALEQRRKSLSGFGIDITWSTMHEYLERLEQVQLYCNVVPLIGHGNVRGSVLGYENRQPSREEMERMQQLVKEGMDAGAWGLSSGLFYPPGVYAAAEESSAWRKLFQPAAEYMLPIYQ